MRNRFPGGDVAVVGQLDGERPQLSGADEVGGRRSCRAKVGEGFPDLLGGMAIHGQESGDQGVEVFEEQFLGGMGSSWAEVTTSARGCAKRKCALTTSFAEACTALTILDCASGLSPAFA